MSLENPTIVQATSNTVTVVLNPSLNQIAVVEPQTLTAVVRDSVIRGPEGPRGPTGPTLPITGSNTEILFVDGENPNSSPNLTFNAVSKLLSAQNVNVNGLLVTQNIIPNADITYSLGSPTRRFKDIYLTGNTIYLGNTQLSGNDNTFTVKNNTGSEIVLDAANSEIAIGNTILTSINGTSLQIWSGNTNNYIILDTVNQEVNTELITANTVDVENVNTTSLFVAQDATVEGNLTVGGHINIGGDISLDGNLIIGNVNTDTVTVIADFTSNLVPDANATYNLGAAGKEWNNLYVGTANLSGSLNVAGDISLGGNLIIGNVNTDTVSVVADFTSNLVPDTSGTFNLGAPAQEWKNIYANTANLSSTLNVAGVVAGKGNVITIGDNISDNSTSPQSVNTTYIAANVVISGPTQTTYNVFTTNSDTPHTIDSFPSSHFTTVKYIIQAKSVDGYHSTELFTMQDGISAYLTEYATLINSHTLGSYSLTVSGGICNLIFHPNNPDNNIITVKLVRTAITA